MARSNFEKVLSAEKRVKVLDAFLTHSYVSLTPREVAGHTGISEVAASNEMSNLSRIGVLETEYTNGNMTAKLAQNDLTDALQTVQTELLDAHQSRQRRESLK